MKMLFFIIVTITAAQANEAIASLSTSSTPPCTQQEFDSLHQAASAKRDILANLVKEATSKGHECTYEYITLNVTNLFLNFSLYDFNHTDDLCHAYSNQYGKDGCNLGKAMPCRELNKTLDILEKATQDFKNLSQNVSFYRRPVPSHNFNNVKQMDGYFYSSKSMQPLFSGGYDHGDYAFYYGFESDIVKQVKPIGQDSDEVDVHIATLIPTEGNVNNSEIDRVISTFNRLYSLGLTSGLVLGCNLPAWVVEKYPEIAEYGSSSCKLNTDHPAVLELWKQGLTPLIQKLKSNPALNSYRLGNEVFFGVMGNKTLVSNFTITKWHEWLKNKYNNVSELNNIWKRSYKAFDQVFFPGNIKSKGHSIEPDKSLIGGPQWYDYCKFNGERIINFYTELIQIIESIHPEALSHIKFVNHHLFTYYYCNGVDRIALNNLTDWSGCDTRMMTAPVSYINTPSRDSGQYAMDWLPPALAYTWMRTTTPSKPVIDLEVHPITTSKFRNGSVPDNHMSAATWIIHLHGLALHMTWAWPREANGSYKFDIVDSYPTLPQAVDGYGKTLALINALSPEVLALANAPKPVCLLWSRDSSIQDMDYLMTQIDTFEALFFYGPQPQFIAEPFVEGSETFVKLNCKVLVIPGQQYVSDDIVSAVESYVNDKKGHVIITGNKAVFQYTPSGKSRTSSRLKFLKDIPHFSDQDPKQLLQLLEPQLIAAEADKIVACVDSTNNITLWGLMCRGVKMPDSKSVVVFIMNILTKPLEVRIYVQGRIMTEAKDMYMFNIIDLKLPLKMDPLNMHIFQIDHKN